jgi:AcrR family transcriptional regulator
VLPQGVRFGVMRARSTLADTHGDVDASRSYVLAETYEIKLHRRMKRKRKTQSERREETREQVLAAAARVFAQRGFHATSLDAIAEDAGFSRGAVYYNFADKEELFLELLDRRCAERAQDLRDVFVNKDEDDVASTSGQARLAAEHALDAMTGDPEWRALYLEFLAQAARDAAFRRRFARRTDEMRGALEEVVVERTREVASALGMEPAQLAVVIDALGIGLMTTHLLHGSRAVPRDLFSDALALIVDGIAARAGLTPQPTERSRR